LKVFGFQTFTKPGFALVGVLVLSNSERALGVLLERTGAKVGLFGNSMRLGLAALLPLQIERL
jgi:hypothetical protein